MAMPMWPVPQPFVKRACEAVWRHCGSFGVKDSVANELRWLTLPSASRRELVFDAGDNGLAQCKSVELDLLALLHSRASLLTNIHARHRGCDRRLSQSPAGGASRERHQSISRTDRAKDFDDGD